MLSVRSIPTKGSIAMLEGLAEFDLVKPAPRTFSVDP